MVNTAAYLQMQNAKTMSNYQAISPNQHHSTTLNERTGPQLIEINTARGRLAIFVRSVPYYAVNRGRCIVKQVCFDLPAEYIMNRETETGLFRNANPYCC